MPLAPGVLANTDEEKHFIGATEYAKDGLLPMIELLGPDPWIGRLREITDRFLDVSATPTPDGDIVSNSTEINGNVLQVLSRLYWQTRDERYLEMGNRVASAYLDHQIPNNLRTCQSSAGTLWRRSRLDRADSSLATMAMRS